MKRLGFLVLAAALFLALGVSTAIAEDSTYLLSDQFGGDWADVEKSPATSDDDLLCWAATASNILEWTGWGFVSTFDDADDMFAHYVDAFPNKTGNPYPAWSWWFNGSPVTPGGGFWPEPAWVFSDYASIV